MVSYGYVGAVGDVFASFLVCFGVSVGVTVLKEKMENRKMEAALERIRKEGYGYQDGNGN